MRLAFPGAQEAAGGNALAWQVCDSDDSDHGAIERDDEFILVITQVSITMDCHRGLNNFN